jgi:hypothetical protein
MKNLLFLFLAGTIVFFSSCAKDEDKAAPVVSNPATEDVEVETDHTVTFNFTAEAGFSSSSVSATNGTAVVSQDGAGGATSGTVVVTYTAGSTAGAGSVILTVTDGDGKASTGTAVLNVVTEKIEFVVSSNITENTTWETGKVYILASRISVEAGAELTIQPGVIIKGEAGTGANATALLVARNAKLFAEGTADQPIIFTSVADEIQPGQVVSPNLDPSLNGLWGGLLILGNARISADASPSQIEGIPPSDPNGLYGGEVDDDNSGIVRFVSVRHGGANIGEGNEINGITLGGVGNGTVIENVEVVANQDDGIEWFGGTVNVTHALVWNPGDDAIDTDQAWAGTLNNFIVVAGSDTDHALEIDGPEGSYLAGHTVTNGSLKGDGENTELGDFRDGARGNFSNLYFFNFSDPNDGGRGDLSLSGDASQANFANGDLTFASMESTQPAAATTLPDIFKNGTDVAALFVTQGNNTVGADASQFGWTWAAKAGGLNDF